MPSWPRQRTPGLARIASAATAILVFLLVWEAVSRGGVFNEVLFPPPSLVALALFQMIASGSLALDSLASGKRLLLGYGAGAVLGVTLGTLTGRYSIPANFVTPVFQMLRPIPPISFVPIAVLWFGLGEFAKDFLVFWGVFFVVWLNAHLAVSNVDRTFVRAGQALGATERAMLLEIVIPGALPGILAGLRTAIPIAFYSLVAGEVAGATHGVAYMIELAHTNFQVARMFAGLAVLGLGSAAADRAFVSVSTKLFPWAQLRT